MDKSQKRTLLTFGMVTAIAGWSSLIFLVTKTLPTVPNRWLFFLLLQITISGTAALILVWVKRDIPSAGIILRQATWIGLVVAIIAWLKIADLLSLPLLLFTCAIFAIIEYLLHIRERAEKKGSPE